MFEAFTAAKVVPEGPEWLYESGTYVKFTQGGSELSA
jgi:hypothetical protein